MHIYTHTLSHTLTHTYLGQINGIDEGLIGTLTCVCVVCVCVCVCVCVYEGLAGTLTFEGRHGVRCIP